MTDEDEDIDMDEWFAMSDAERDAIEAREWAKYERWRDSLTVAQEIRVDTRSALRSIMENRRRLQNPALCTIPFVVNLWREGIRRNQRRLVKLRIWRSTGTYPGEG
jgi:hypothetical protein